MMLDRKQIRVILLFEFQTGLKQQRQLSRSTAHLAQNEQMNILMNILCNDVSRSFAKETRALNEECSSRRSEVDDDKLRAIIETDPLTTTLEVAKNSMMTILLSFSIWRKLQRWKSSVSGCLMSWLKIKSFWSVIFSFLQQQPFVHQVVTYDKKWIIYNNCK